MNPKDSKSLNRLIANLQSDPDVQAAIRARTGKNDAGDRFQAIKDAVFQNVQRAFAKRAKNAAEGSKNQSLTSGLIVWIGSFAARERITDDRLAASGEGKTTDAKIFDIADRSLRLLFEYTGETVLCTVLDSNDLPSSELDGATFADVTGKIVGRVDDSQARLGVSAISQGIILRDASGLMIDTREQT